MMELNPVDEPPLFRTKAGEFQALPCHLAVAEHCSRASFSPSRTHRGRLSRFLPSPPRNPGRVLSESSRRGESRWRRRENAMCSYLRRGHCTFEATKFESVISRRRVRPSVCRPGGLWHPPGVVSVRIGRLLF